MVDQDQQITHFGPVQHLLASESVRHLLRDWECFTHILRLQGGPEAKTSRASQIGRRFLLRACPATNIWWTRTWQKQVPRRLLGEDKGYQGLAQVGG